MKAIVACFTTVIFLVTTWAAFGQCNITITTQPTNQNACVGSTASFDVGTTAPLPLTCQWQANFGSGFQDLPNETNQTLMLSNLQALHEGDYRAVISDGTCSTNSEPAHLFLNSPPSFSNTYYQPTNWPYPVSLGVTMGNRVSVSGTSPFTYQWRLNGVPIPGQTSFALTITNVHMTNAGSYDVVVANSCGTTNSQTVTLRVDPTFTKITTGVIVTDRANFAMPYWGDYDDDGFPDLFVPAGPEVMWQRPALYHNLGGTNFVRVGGVVELSRPYCADALWADFNNDGYLDLLEIGWLTDQWGASNRLFLGRPDHTFVWYTNAPGANPPIVGSSTHCALVDYDNDGAVDVFHPNGWLSGYNTHATLMGNLGDATFTPAWSPGGPIYDTFTAPWGDYDNDGDRDVWVLGGGYPAGTSAQFYRNNGDGTLETRTTGIPAVYDWFGACADYNNDGYLDLLTWSRLYRNEMGTNFTDAMNWPSPDWVCIGLWGDYDNDGDLDTVWGGQPTPCWFLRNDGELPDGTPVFTRVDLGSPSHDVPARSASPGWCDYNNDGFLDLFVGTLGNPSGANLLYRGSGLAGGNTNRWLIVKPRGVASNYSAIGVKVRVKATIRGRVTWQMREIAGGYLDDLRAHFGLGDATNVDLVKVEWTSGIVQELTNVAPGQILTVVESQGYIGSLPAFARATTATNGLQISIIEPAAQAVYALQASTDLVNWTKLMARKSTGGTFAYTDTRSAGYPRRFYRVVVP